MSDAPINIEIRDKVGSGIAGKIIGIAEAARQAYTATEQLKTQLATLNLGGLNKLQAAVDKNATANERLQQALLKTAAASEKLNAASAKTSKEMFNSAAASSRAELAALRLEQAKKRLADSSRNAGNAILGFTRNVAAFVGVAFGLNELKQAADAYTSLQNKLRTVVDTEEQLAEVTKRITKIASDTYAPVDDTAKAFVRFDMAMKNLGASQNETLRLTETVNKAIKLSGATSAEAGSALLQLSQAFNKGKLDGDEFRSVMELMPSAADAIAKQLKVTRGDLLKLAPEGKITAEVLRAAFAGLATEVDGKFSKVFPTINDSLQKLRNNGMQWLGEFNKAIGITAAISAGISLLADNLDTLAVALTAVGATMLVAFGPAIVGAIGTATAAVWGFTAAIAANPIGLLVVGITTAISAMFFFGKEILTTGDKVSAFGISATDVFLGVGDAAIGIAKGVAQAFEGMVAKIIVGVHGLLEYINSHLPDEFKLSLKSISPDIANSAGMSLGESFMAGFRRVQNEGFRAQWKNGSLFGNKQNVQAPSQLRPAGPGVASTLQTPDKAAVKRAFELSKINNELDSQLKLMNKVGFAYKVEQEMTKITNALFDKKITLTQKETEAIRNKVTQLEYEKGVHSQLERIYDDTFGKQISLTQQVQALNEAYARGMVTLDEYTNRLVKLKIEAANLQLQMGNMNFSNFATASLGRLVEQYEGVAKGLTDSFGSFFQSFTDGFADSVGRAVVYSEDLETALKSVAQSAIAELISSLVKLGVQYAANAALGNSIQAASLASSTAMNVAAGSASAAAWAPAAALASLATLGAAGLASTVALSQSLAAISKFAGFEQGGFTGNMGTSNIAGVVHGKEFVFDAAATQRIGVGNLEALRSGASYNVGSASGSQSGGLLQSNVQVNITNQIPDAEYDIQQVTPGQVEIIARRIMQSEAPSIIANDMNNPNSRTSKALSKNTTTQRKRN